MKIKKGLFGFGRRVDTDTANVMQEYGNEKLKVLLSIIDQDAVLYGLDVEIDLTENEIIISPGAYVFANAIFKVDEEIRIDLPELEEGKWYHLYIRPKLVQDGFWSNRYGNGYLWEIEDNEVKISDSDEPGFLRFYSILLEDDELEVYVLREEKSSVYIKESSPLFINLNADKLDGFHASELSGSKILGAGLCFSGEVIPLPQDKQNVKISVFPILKRGDYKVLSRPQITSISGGIAQSSPIKTYYYTVVARDSLGRYSEPSMILTYTKVPHQDLPITISWSSVNDATDYAVFGYREGDDDWTLLGISNTTSFSFNNFSGTFSSPFASQSRFISVSTKIYNSVFQPFLEIYSFDSQTNVLLNHALNNPGQSYIWSMPDGSNTNYIKAKTEVSFCVERSAFAGECIVTIRWAIGIKKYNETSWEEKEYVINQWVPNPGLFGGKASYTFNYEDIFKDLDIDRYQLRWRFISAYLSNGNYWWVWRYVKALSATYYTATKLDELSGVYIIYEEKGE